MLRILRHEPVRHTLPQVQTDFYVPLDVTLPRTPGLVPIYWRTGDLQRTLIEVGLEPGSGLLVSVTATNVPTTWTRDELQPPVRQPGEQGRPVMDIAQLQGAFTDEPGPVLLYLGPDFVWLAFTEGTPHVRELLCGELRFLIGADDAWLGLVVGGLSPAQMKELRAGVLST